MRIVYCISGTFNSGGMERVLSIKANYLSNLGNDIYIITSDQCDNIPYFELNENITKIDLNINYRENNSKNPLLKSIFYLKKQKLHKYRLSRILKEIKADIVISMFDHDASFLYKIKDGSKKVLEIHFSKYKRLQYDRSGVWAIIDQVRTKLDLLVVQKYNKFVVLTKEDQGYWGDLKNITVIPNFNSFEVDKVAKLNNPQAIAVGRYDYQKGFDYLIDAWKKVNEIHPTWTLSIFGNGPLKENLQLKIDKLNLSDVVKLIPAVKNIQDQYLKSSILVMTSRYEGLPMSLLEGQVCGLPLVALECKCGPKDIIIDGKNGFLIPMGDQEKLSTRIVELIENDDLRIEMGENSRMLAKNFSLDTIMTKWINLFKEILSNPK